MGLKPYDLIWSEGKSAAWRYPSEIEELSTFAPAVEEQPFDRFYKKASPAAPAQTTNTTASSQTVKRIIYVTMPAGKTPPPLRESPRETVAPAPAPAKPVAAIPDYAAEPMEQLSPIGYLPRRQPQHTGRIVRFLVIGTGVLVLLAAGIFIGLSMNKVGLQQKVVAKSPPTETAQTIVHTTAQPLAAPAVTGGEKPADSAGAIATKPAVTGTPIYRPASKLSKNKLIANRQKESAPHLITMPRLVPVGDSGESATGHREAVHRTDLQDDPHPDDAALRASLASQVSVGANSYSVGTFGGINDLQLTVTNRSVYPLDLVIVEVQYIQANKKVYKTENLYFHGIGAGSALMQEAPRSSRGVKVQYKITAISSRELGLTYSGI